MLPSGFIFFQRDWLSSNSLLLKAPDSAYLFDSGYVTHADQLSVFLRSQLHNQPLDVLINTHLHSDHCGGNALLQSQYDELEVWIPATQFSTVAAWNENALSYPLTGQQCPRFRPTAGISAGDSFSIQGLNWDAYPSLGHDNDSLIFFQADHSILLSADALWENGLSVVFPEFLGGKGFENVAQTYDLIERLSPKTVLPGHGAIYTDVSKALGFSRQRLDYFVKNPSSHAAYAAKVLLKFKLMELQQSPTDDFLRWCDESSLLQMIHCQFFESNDFSNWVYELISSLEAKNALQLRNNWIFNN